MAHVQQQILDAVTAILLAAGTDAGNSVYLDRVDPLREDMLPALKVHEATQGEESDPQTVSGGESRNFNVLITCVVSHGNDFAARVRELGLQVEKALTVRGVALPKSVRGQVVASRITLDGEGQSVMAQREQLWRFTYSIRRGAPDVAV